MTDEFMTEEEYLKEYPESSHEATEEEIENYLPDAADFDT